MQIKPSLGLGYAICSVFHAIAAWLLYLVFSIWSWETMWWRKFLTRRNKIVWWLNLAFFATTSVFILCYMFA